MDFVLLVGLVLLYAKDGDCACISKTLTARTSLQSFSHTYYSNNEDCSFTIKPLYTSGYYLEISWSTFDVEGSMPTCYDYAEVFLTRSYTSIGKYCSGNLNGKKPFNMYSKDGYAKIKFHSDASTTKAGFSIKFRLRSKRYSHLGLKTVGCSNTGSNVGVYYSKGWPNGYLGSNLIDYCWFRHTQSTSSSIRIVVMDLDLYQLRLSSSCSSSDDFLQVRGSSTSYSDGYSIRTRTVAISGKLCGTARPSYYTSNYRNVYVYVKRRTGSTSKRGFIVGYIVYAVGGGGGSTKRRRVEVRRRTVEVRRRAVDVRRRAVDVRRRAVDVRRRAVDVRRRAVDVRRRAVDVRRRVVDVRRRAVDVRRRVVVLRRRAVAGRRRIKVSVSRRTLSAKRKGLSTGATAGISVGAVVILFVIVALVCWKVCKIDISSMLQC